MACPSHEINRVAFLFQVHQNVKLCHHTAHSTLSCLDRLCPNNACQDRLTLPYQLIITVQANEIKILSFRILTDFNVGHYKVPHIERYNQYKNRQHRVEGQLPVK